MRVECKACCLKEYHYFVGWFTLGSWNSFVKCLHKLSQMPDCVIKVDKVDFPVFQYTRRFQRHYCHVSYFVSGIHNARKTPPQRIKRFLA